MDLNNAIVELSKSMHLFLFERAHVCRGRDLYHQLHCLIPDSFPVLKPNNIVYLEYRKELIFYWIFDDLNRPDLHCTVDLTTYKLSWYGDKSESPEEYLKSVDYSD